MAWPVALASLLGALLAMMALGIPVVFAFFGVNILGAIIFLGGDAGLVQLLRNVSSSVSNFSLVPIPLFVFMGEVMYHTGMAQRAIDAIDRLIYKIPGRLSIVAIVGGTIFAALSGSTMANTAMLGSTLLPEMQRRGYDRTIAMGPILGTGGIAMLIPPSGLAVLLASLAKIPIADLLIAGIIPGLIFAALFFGYIVVRCTLDPRLAPAEDRPREPLARRMVPFLVYVLPLMLIFVVVVGSILGGVATPSESAALGGVASVVAAVGYRRLTWQSFATSILETAKISAMIFFIASASLTFSQILAFSGATQGLLEELRALNLGPTALIAGMLLVLLFMGCFLDQLSMMLITLPFFMPLAQALGLDLVWFGILLLLVLEISFTTPPFGMLLFVMKGVAPPDTTMRDIIVAATPFVLLELLGLVLMFLYPPLVTWLPALIQR
ncbi:MAG: TRAP transporter large permease [Betaproteobacteria bacterium]|nr:MAG: TRAP transporter large permease [Betaproteobacteria bacterium]